MATESNQPRVFPFATYILVYTNLVLYIAQVISYQCFGSYEWWHSNLLVSGQVVDAFAHPSPGQLLFAGWSVLVTMFLHATGSCVAGNMLILYFVGRTVEQKLGWRLFLASYFLTGFAGTVPFILNLPTSKVPCVGAGIAVAGILGMFYVLFFTRELLADWKLWLKLIVTGLGLFWVGQQIYGIYMDAIGQPLDNIAYWGELGGFVSGVLVAAIVALATKKVQTTALVPA